MLKRVMVWLPVIVLTGLLLPIKPVAAASQQPDDGVVIWNEDYVLAEDREVDGDIIVFNGDAALEAGSRVNGGVNVWNGNANVDGVVGGTLIVSNGDIQLDENAHVHGDVVCVWNCHIERAEGARVDGELTEGSFEGIPFGQLGEPGLRIIRPPSEPDPFWRSGPEQLLRWILRMIRRLMTVVVVAVIGGVVALIWPAATTQVGRTVFESPGASLGVGLLTTLAGVALIIALAITICLSPAAAMVALALTAAGLFGWVAIGTSVGTRLLRALNADQVAPLWRAGLGTLIITSITVGLSSAFCLSPLGWFLIFVIGCFGLGAVVLTRFGTTPYVPDRHREPVPPPPSPHPSEQTPYPVIEGEHEDVVAEEDQAT